MWLQESNINGTKATGYNAFISQHRVACNVASKPTSVMGDRLKLKFDFAPSDTVQSTTVDVLTPTSIFVTLLAATVSTIVAYAEFAFISLQDYVVTRMDCFRAWCGYESDKMEGAAADEEVYVSDDSQAGAGGVGIKMNPIHDSEGDTHLVSKPDPAGVNETILIGARNTTHVTQAQYYKLEKEHGELQQEHNELQQEHNELKEQQERYQELHQEQYHELRSMLAALQQQAVPIEL